MTAWRFGSDILGWLDLPVGPDVPVNQVVVGGSQRGIGGRLNSDRKALKYEYPLPLQGWLLQPYWVELFRMQEQSPGPYELYDASRPTILSAAHSLGVGLKTAAGAAVPSQPDMRCQLGSTATEVQTGRTSSPALGDVIPALPSRQYTFGVTFEVPTSFAGYFGVYGYTALGVGSGVLQGSTVPVTSSGRKKITVTTGSTINYLQLRAVRTSGTARVSDWVGNFGAYDLGPNIRKVLFQGGLPRIVHRPTRESSFTLNLAEV